MKPSPRQVATGAPFQMLLDFVKHGLSNACPSPKFQLPSPPKNQCSNLLHKGPVLGDFIVWRERHQLRQRIRELVALSPYEISKQVAVARAGQLCLVDHHGRNSCIRKRFCQGSAAVPEAMHKFHAELMSPVNPHPEP